MPVNYNNFFNPAPQAGSGTFGSVPGVLTPPNPARDVGGQLPGLPGLNRTLSGDLQAKLGGQLSPGTQNMLQDLGAAWGVGSGMPGSGLSRNRTLRDLGLLSENQVQQGIQDYSTVLPTVASTQTVSPALQTEIALQNAVNAAAPNPAVAASYARQLFEEYLGRMRGPAGGTGQFSIVGGAAPFGPSTPSATSPWASDRPNAPAGGAFFPSGGGAATTTGTGTNPYSRFFSTPAGAGGSVPGAENLSEEDLAYLFGGGALPPRADWSNPVPAAPGADYSSFGAGGEEGQ